MPWRRAAASPGPSTSSTSTSARSVRREGAVPTVAAASDITGQARIDLALPADRAAAERHVRGRTPATSQVAGYEARNVVADGRIDGATIRVERARRRPTAAGRRSTAPCAPATPLALDLQGRASNVDLRNLPASLNVPRVPEPSASSAYTLTGRGARVLGRRARSTSRRWPARRSRRARPAAFSVGAGAPSTRRRARSPASTCSRSAAASTIHGARRPTGTAAASTARSTSPASGGGRFPLTLDATGTLDRLGDVRRDVSRAWTFTADARRRRCAGARQRPVRRSEPGGHRAATSSWPARSPAPSTSRRRFAATPTA